MMLQSIELEDDVDLKSASEDSLLKDNKSSKKEKEGYQSPPTWSHMRAGTRFEHDSSLLIRRLQEAGSTYKLYLKLKCGHITLRVKKQRRCEI